MGQEVSLAALGSRVVRFGGDGIAELGAVELVRDGEVVAGAFPTAPAGEGRLVVPLDVRVVTGEGGTREPTGCITAGGGAALVPADWYPPDVTAVSSTSLAWARRLPEWYAKRRRPPSVLTLGLTVEGPPEAHVTIEADGCRLEATLGELADGCTRSARARTTEISVRRGLGGLTGLGCTSWFGEAPEGVLTPGSWYYVRVVQVDGEAAWSSPIWIDP